MAEDKPDIAWRVVGGLVGLVTAWGARKILAFAWKKAVHASLTSSAATPAARASMNRSRAPKRPISSRT